MRLESLRVHEMGSIHDLEVDLSTFGDARLIAVVGPNGAGKSTALELGLPGVLFRQCPTRGSLQDLARARDSFVEARVVNGSTWTIKHSLDAVSGKGETLVKDADGKPALPGTSVRAFDRWAAKHLPAPEVLFSSIFSAQGTAGFLGMSPGERKACLLRVLGIEHLETLAAGAREHERDAKAELDTLRARIDDERARGGDTEEIEREIEALAAAAACAGAAVETARLALEAARSGAPGLELARLEAQQAREKRADLEARIAKARQELRPLEERIANNRAVLAEADQIRAAKTRSDELTVEIARLGEEARAADERRAAARREWEQHRSAADAAARRIEAASARAARATARLADREKIEAAAAALPGLEDALQRAQCAEIEASAALESVRSQRVAGAEERIGRLRDGLSVISGATPKRYTVEDLAAGATTTLHVDDDAVDLARGLPAAIRLAEEAHRTAQDREAISARYLSDARALAARAGELAAAEEERDQASAEGKTAHEEHIEAVRLKNDATHREKEHEASVLETKAALETAQRDQQTLAPLVTKFAPLGNAEVRLGELEPQAAAARAALADLETALADVPEPPAVPEPPDVQELSKRVLSARTAATAATDAVAKARDRLERAHESARVVAELDEERVRLDDEVSDWNRLARELGRDGLQAAEIDCAGPELTELVNDLLRTCIGPRWTMSIETARASADGKRLLEGCEVRVLDTVGGREAEGSTFSGGEKVLLGESLSLALTMLGCRRAGITRPTLVRDESGAALDPQNARNYVAMLRRAAELVGAYHVLFVSHAPEVVDLADARIELQATGTP